MPLVHKRIMSVDSSPENIEEKCHIILSNWETVCEENDYHRDYVSKEEWDKWSRMRKEVDDKLIELSSGSIGDIFHYLLGIQSKITNARRVDVYSEYLSKKQSNELEQKPTNSLISRLFKIR